MHKFNLLSEMFLSDLHSYLSSADCLQLKGTCLLSQLKDTQLGPGTASEESGLCWILIKKQDR